MITSKVRDIAFELADLWDNFELFKVYQLFISILPIQIELPEFENSKSEYDFQDDGKQVEIYGYDECGNPLTSEQYDSEREALDDKPRRNRECEPNYTPQENFQKSQNERVREREKKEKKIFDVPEPEYDFVN